MNQQIDRQQNQAATDARKDVAFQKFLSKPETKLMLTMIPKSETPEAVETKLMLTMIPKSETPEAVETILRSAFDVGFSEGVSDTTMTFIEAMLKPKTDRL